MNLEVTVTSKLTVTSFELRDSYSTCVAVGCSPLRMKKVRRRILPVKRSIPGPKKRSTVSLKMLIVDAMKNPPPAMMLRITPVWRVPFDLLNAARMSSPIPTDNGSIGHTTAQTFHMPVIVQKPSTSPLTRIITAGMASPATRIAIEDRANPNPKAITISGQTTAQMFQELNTRAYTRIHPAASTGRPGI